MSKFSALLPPELTVNRLEITETDSVTLKCQAPPSVSVSECGFLTLSGGTVRGSSCMRTLMGIELLKMSRQSATVEVKVSCYYTVKLEEKTSPDSNPVSITIQGEHTWLIWTIFRTSFYSMSSNNKVSQVFRESVGRFSMGVLCHYNSSSVMFWKQLKYVHDWILSLRASSTVDDFIISLLFE